MNFTGAKKKGVNSDNTKEGDQNNQGGMAPIK